MKKIYLLAFALLSGFASTAQKASKENVGIGTLSPDQSAVLDIQSINKGLLIPRLTIDQRNSIVNPANGLMVYQTNENSGFFFFNGQKWKPLAETDAKAVTLDIANWSKTGDAGINPATNFLGTTDGNPLIFKIDNQKSGFLGNTSNTHFGYLNGSSNGTGNENSGFGWRALESLTTGYGNAAFGTQALQKNTTGQLNLAFGGISLANNTIGFGNVALGYGALVLNSSGNNNTAIGADALFNNLASGNIAIGRSSLVSTTSGSDNLAIGFEAGRNNVTGTGNVYLGKQSGFSELGDNKLYISNSSTNMPLVYGDFSAKYVTIGDVTPALRTQGTATGGYNLLVKGGILTEKVKVALAAAGTDWADYVFEPEYKSKMMSLEEVEKFTLKNKHLPNVPSAEEMVKSGLDVSQTSKMFMEKIEELTLYMIELNKEVKVLKAENEALKRK